MSIDNIKNFINRHPLLITYSIVFFIGLFFSLWVIRSGMIEGHDMIFHMSRIEGIRDSIINGDYQALIHVGLYGYGYANGLFYGNLLFYIPALFSFKLSLINSYKIYVLLCTFLSSLTMFWCMKGITKSNKAALLGSLFYSACSYKACDFIIRSAAGEMGAFIFLPLIVLGFYYIVYDDYKKWFWFSIGFVGIIQCHLISTLLIFVAILIMLIINWERFIKEKERFYALLTSGVVGLLVGGHFIFPLLEGLSKNNLVASSANTFESWTRTIPFERLFLGFPYYNTNGFTPPGIGLLYFVLLLFRFKIKINKNDKLIKFCDLSAIIGIASLLSATDLFPWREIEFIRAIQFPWRFYLIASLFIIISSTIVTYYYLKDKKKNDIIKFIIPAIIVSIIPFCIIENHYHNNVIYKYEGFDVINGEYLPKGTNIQELGKRGEIVTSNNQDIKLEMEKKGNDVLVKYSNNNSKDTYIDVPLLNYYGYTAIDQNNKKLKIINGDNNIIRVNLEDENGSVVVYYKGTFIQKISLILSIISTIGLIIYLYRRKDLLKL